MIDLHIHSTYSDGTFSPKEIIDYAKKKGLKTIALTDHDTINGLSNFLSIKTDLIKIPGTEISIDYQKGTFHMVGLFIDHNNPYLQEKLNILIKYRRERNLELINKIQKMFGIMIDLDNLQKKVQGELGRPHFAKILVEHNIVKSTQEAFEKYLGKGCPLYIPKKRYSIAEAIEMIHQAGGLAIIAHPITLKIDNPQFDNFIKKLKDSGIDGIEVFCSLHSEKESKFYLEIAQKYNLFISAGSDFHGENKEDVDLGQTNCPKTYQKTIYENIQNHLKTLALKY